MAYRKADAPEEEIHTLTVPLKRAMGLGVCLLIVPVVLLVFVLLYGLSDPGPSAMIEELGADLPFALLLLVAVVVAVFLAIRGALYIHDGLGEVEMVFTEDDVFIPRCGFFQFRTLQLPYSAIHGVADLSENQFSSELQRRKQGLKVSFGARSRSISPTALAHRYPLVKTLFIEIEQKGNLVLNPVRKTINLADARAKKLAEASPLIEEHHLSLLGLKESPLLDEILEKCREEQLKENISTYDEGMELAQELLAASEDADREG